MTNKNDTYDKVYFGNLLVYYGTFLTEKQRDYMRLYYQEDYSLQEIAEIYHVSRSAIHAQLQHAQKKLLTFEKELQIHVLVHDILPALEDGINQKDWVIVTESANKLKTITKERE